MNIGELFVKLGFKVDDKGLKNVDKGMKATKDTALETKAAIVLLTVAIKKMIGASLEAAVTLKNFQIQTGLSREEFQKWGFIAEQNDISGQELVSTIKGIQKAQAEIRLGGGNIKPFQLLGISPTEDPFRVLEQLKGKIKNLDPAIASSVLGQMGVGDNFLNILKNSNLEFNKLNKQFLLSQKEQDNLIILNKSFKELGFSLRGIRDRFIALISPTVASFFEAIINNFKVMVSFGSFILDLAKKFKILAVAIGLVGVVLAAIFFPIPTLIAGIIGAVIVIIDDLYTFFKGGDSVFGLFVDGIVKAFTFLKGVMKTVFEFIKDGFDKFISPMLEKLEGVLNNSFVAKIMGKEETSTPISASAGGNSSQNTNNININVNGSNGDSKKTAFDIKEALGKELDKAYYTRSAAGV